MISQDKTITEIAEKLDDEETKEQISELKESDVHVIEDDLILIKEVQQMQI